MPDPVPGCEIRIDGAPVDAKVMHTLLDVQVRHSLLLPATAHVRFRDPQGEFVSDRSFAIGKEVEIKLAPTFGTVLSSTFKGEIVAIEPEFGVNDLVIAFRAYDRGWRLNRRRKSRTFQDVTVTDMIKTVVSEDGLTPGELSAGTTQYEFFQQSMETDWEFCWRLARQHNCELVVDGKTLHFRPRESAAAVATLEWGADEEKALLSFRPRMSGVGQVRTVTVSNHDPKSKRTVTGQAATPTLPYTPEAANGRNGAVATLSGDIVTVADRVAETMAEAEAIAKSTLDRLSSSFIEAEGKTYGNPVVRAGATLGLRNVGQFSGDYVLTETTHRFGSGEQQYATTFRVSGRASHTFRDLLKSNHDTDWASSLVIGIVTNNLDDQEKLGRVKVKYPALGDEIESGWARVVTPNAGNDRGMFYMPQVGDEVVVAFEHGDTRRPLIIGSLFNGVDTPPKELVDQAGGPDGKQALFGIKTPHEAYVESTQKMTFTSHEQMTVEVQKDGRSGTGDYTMNAEGKVEQKAGDSFEQTSAREFLIDAGSSVTIKGNGSITVEAKGGITLDGATVDIKAKGVVNIKGTMINLG